MPTVSVIISIRNCEKYIGECLESLAAQTFKDFEVVVVLDAPTDSTPEIVESWLGRLDIKIIRNEKQMGKPWNLNRAWAEARGEFIAQVDGDDVILPHKLALQAAFMRHHPELGFSGTMGRYFGAKTGRITIPCSPLNCRFWLLWCASPFLHSTAMFRRAAFENAGVKYREELIHTQDFRLFADAVLAGIKFANIGNDLYRWRQHPANGKIKDSAYFDSFRRTNESFILKTLGLPASDAELAIHYRVAAMDIPDTPEGISAALAWIEKLAACDCGKLGIPRLALARMLRLRWAVVAFRNTARRRSPHAALYFGKAGAFDPLGFLRLPLLALASVRSKK